MGFHPINLSLRFVLELIGLAGLFRLGLSLGEGFGRWLLAFGLTFIAMALWASFRVPGDPSAKGDAPVPVNGRTRLVIELLVFGAGGFGWFVTGPRWLAWAYLVALVAHHLVSYDRIAWLMSVDRAGQPEVPA